MEHKWKSVPGGEWFDSYKCTHCGIEVNVAAEAALGINEKTLRVKQPCAKDDDVL